MKTELKTYVYHVKDDFILDIELLIYARNKKQADEMIEMLEKKKNYNCEYKKLGKSKKHYEQLQVLLNKFGSDENLIQAQLKLLTEEN